MIFPELVPDQVCTTPIHVTIESEEIGEEGQPIYLLDDDFKCNYQDKSKRILTANQKIVTITGSAYLNGDIAPNVAVISGGIAVVFGVERRIALGQKARNPDGSVNYTRLELM